MNNEPHEGPRDNATEEPDTSFDKILRYFSHGFLFSLIVGNLGTLLGVILFPLIVPLFILGFFILIFTLVSLVGWTNTKLADYLWDIKCAQTLRSYIAHGVMLLATLFLFYIPIGAYEWAFLESNPDFTLVSRLITLVLYSIIDGFLGRLISEQFLDKDEYVGGSLRHRRGTTIVDYGMKEAHPIQGHCTHCNQTHWYDESAISDEGTLQCKACGERFVYEPNDSTLE